MSVLITFYVVFHTSWSWPICSYY